MKYVMVWLLGGLLVAGSSGTAFAQENKDKGVKEDVKEAGKATGRAAKKSGKAIKKGTKKVVHAGAKKTRQGAGAVEEKTEKK
ncbi:MAG TPA: hypothetical protein VE422_25390 [Terriglobia bacterium]|nr:hypothetical protein [Terriglobia bacterium]